MVLCSRIFGVDYKRYLYGNCTYTAPLRPSATTLYLLREMNGSTPAEANLEQPLSEASKFRF